MIPEAILLAKSEVRSATKAFEALIAAKNAEDGDDAWRNFATAFSAFYEKLKKGAADTSASKTWCDKIFRERAKDELLKYVHESRNSRIHHITPITRASVVVTPLSFSNGRGLIAASQGQVLGKQGSVAKLKTVVNDHGTFPPPTMHLDQAINGSSPRVVASAALKRIKELLIEAEALRSPQ